MKILAIDYGEAKIGLALGDTESRLALPLSILKNNGWNEIVNQLKDIIGQENISKIIVGLPINRAAHSSKQINRVQEFISFLEDKLKLDIETRDESFSSQAAQKLKPGKRDDDVAAMIFLQDYLDSLNF